LARVNGFAALDDLLDFEDLDVLEDLGFGFRADRVGDRLAAPRRCLAMQCQAGLLRP
jgi:hypothetical protein